MSSKSSFKVEINQIQAPHAELDQHPSWRMEPKSRRPAPIQQYSISQAQAPTQVAVRNQGEGQSWTPHTKFAGTALSICFGYGRFSSDMILTKPSLVAVNLGLNLSSSATVETLRPL
mmetsp:Transcript_89960/g.188089  ORF Transcript_89960/g.188089 Transcript_89960/m.188089 type:complete len:117 (-) Transcript_89960:1246-1596(-)